MINWLVVIANTTVLTDAVNNIDENHILFGKMLMRDADWTDSDSGAGKSSKWYEISGSSI